VKRLALTILAAVLAAALPAHSLELRWEPRWQSVAPGADGSVAVVLDDALDIRTIEVFVEYDPEVVTSVGSSAGSIYDGVGCFLLEDCEVEEPGLFHAYVVLMGGVCYATGPGELLVWHFTAGSETGATDLTVLDVYLSNPDAEPIPDLSLGAATIAVCDPPSDAPPVPGGTSLRVHPNPFNPRTTLTASGSGARPARLEAYDLAGRHLGVLWSGTLGPRPVSADWRGEMPDGRPLPSGTYLFSLSVRGEAPVVVRGLLLR